MEQTSRKRENMAWLGEFEIFRTGQLVEEKQTEGNRLRRGLMGTELHKDEFLETAVMLVQDY